MGSEMCIRDRGRREPFWLRNPLQIFDFIKLNSPTQIVVARRSFLSSVPEVLAFRDLAGANHFTRVTGAAINGDTFVIDVQDPIPEFYAFSSGHLVRFTTDQLSELWADLEAVTVTAEMVEVQNENEFPFV